MAKIERKLGTVKSNVGEIQTSFQWTVDIEADGSNSLVGDTKKFKWRLNGVSGIAAPGVDLITVETNGFKIPFFGKSDKSGEITLSGVYEDIEGTVGKFYRKLMRSYYKGSSSATEVSALENVSTKYSNKLRWKIKVTLADSEGKSTRVWTFFNALVTPDFSLDLNQDSAPVQYNFKVTYTTFTEGDGNASDAW